MASSEHPLKDILKYLCSYQDTLLHPVHSPSLLGEFYSPFLLPVLQRDDNIFYTLHVVDIVVVVVFVIGLISLSS